MPRADKAAVKAKKPLKEQIQRRARKKPEKKQKEMHFDPARFVSSGSTLLNLALTDDPFCGWQKGKMFNVIGDSGAGKTLICLTAFAEASIDRSMDEHRLLFDDAENALEFDVSDMFGEAVQERMECPGRNEEPSETVEDFQDNVLLALEKKAPFFYILDSADALDADADLEKIEEQREARAKGKEVKGSYGTAKAKGFSTMLRGICGKLKRGDSLLGIISQTRDNIGLGFAPKTRSGGKALKFYATHEVWVALVETLKGRGGREIGAMVRLRVSKNKITGKKREVQFPIYYDMGIDDVTSCIEFLLKEKWWEYKSAKKEEGATKKVARVKKDGEESNKGKLIDTFDDLGLEPMTFDKLVEAIEEQGLEDKLREVTGECWKKIEESLKLGRKKRY